MIFSKTTTYAVRILIFMAGENRAVFSAQYLFENLAIHNRYLRRVLTKLTNAGFLKSMRGKNGGFTFSRSPERIFLSEILAATEGMDTLEGCVMGINDCRLTERCILHHMWEDTRNKMIAAFSNTSLLQLIHGSEYSSPS
jgi:Rrf2 family transcriptional regulator, nitric oxide-sensitive transcriptional repressor